jgi:hypothetical protein
VWATPVCLGGHDGPLSDVESVVWTTGASCASKPRVQVAGRQSVSFSNELAARVETRVRGGRGVAEPSEGPASDHAQRASLTAWSKRE